jgi:SAM-dependent methyltransferase
MAWDFSPFDGSNKMAKTDYGIANVSRQGGYVFDTAGQQAGARFDALASMFNSATMRHIEQRGIRQGWDCLEIGGGGGSIAAWLAERVGPTGHVLTTDIDTRFLEALNLPNLEVRRHDIVRDPLPRAAFDLVHERLVLIHLPERRRVLEGMAAALKPGGWLVIEEFDTVSMRADPEINPAEVKLKTQIGLRRVMQERGLNLCYGRLLCGGLRAVGLAEVELEGRVIMCQGGSAGARLVRANHEQLRNEILATGLVTEQEFELDMARLDEPDYLAPSPIMWSAWGRRPQPCGVSLHLSTGQSKSQRPRRRESKGRQYSEYSRFPRRY